jgi:dolichol-phosphate mannosyltransferase
MDNISVPLQSNDWPRPADFLLSIVIPVYNEESNIAPLVDRLKKVALSIGCRYEIIFSMDPSSDQTEEKILAYISYDANIKLIKYSRKFGQPSATLGGLRYASGEACVVIDADLQDPPELIVDMVDKWRQGYDVVYAQRRTRDGETLIKKVVSNLGYSIINKVAEVEIPRNTGDFRLMSRKVVEHLKDLKESHGFLRGMVALVGFNQAAVVYDRDTRLSGKSKYNRNLGSLRIGLNGLYGFSRYPLHLISMLGMAIAFLSFLIASVYIVTKLAGINIPWGNPTLVILISFLSGIQLLSFGVMGEYIGRIYDEVKERPLYIVDRTYGFENNQNGTRKRASHEE